MRHLLHQDPVIFELGAPGRSGVSLPALDVDDVDLTVLYGDLRRRLPPDLPEVSEPEVTRHFTRLSRWNYAVDIGMYPLGSCTMKYSPKVNEHLSRLAGFSGLHPAQPSPTVRGLLLLMHHLERALCELGGFARATLQPSAGAHGELCGLLMMLAYHRDRGRNPATVIIPDSAHGTNAATCALGGRRVVSVATGRDGILEVDDVRAVCRQHADDVAGMMITNPSTLGLFEEQIVDIISLIHDEGGLVYLDGANFNALLGKVRPGDLGADCMHTNLHKTFSAPHGGGGPGAGPLMVAEPLVPFLPTPTVEMVAGEPTLEWTREKSIGRLRSFFGNVAVLIKAYAYIREMGGDGLTRVSEAAVLNANYLRARLCPAFPLASHKPTMHEVIVSDSALAEETGVRTIDIAKRLLDYGYHPPTVHFPLIVRGALMIEPTETESKAAIDAFADALASITSEARDNPDLVKTAPHETALRRLDEGAAARTPVLRWVPHAKVTS